jgi:hypothetical protein
MDNPGARNLLKDLGQRASSVKFLIRARGPVHQFLRRRMSRAAQTEVHRVQDP